MTRAGALLVALAIAGGAQASVTDAIDGLGSEADECGLLVALCKIAQTSVDRAEGTPGTADVLATRQALTADARVDEAREAARAIERKHGRRLACLDDEACRGIVPRAPGR